MCKYCEKLENEPIAKTYDGELVIEYGKLIAADFGAELASANINFCPMCGRRIDGENKPFPKEIIDKLALMNLKIHVPPEAEPSPKDIHLFRVAFAEGFEEALKHIK